MNISPFGIAVHALSWKFKLGAALLAAAAVAGAALAFVAWIEAGKQQARDAGIKAGRAEVQARWDAAKRAQDAADLEAARENALESRRRLAKQQENQHAQNQELARARADAERNARAADQLRRDHEAAADQWRRALADSPTSADVEAAGAAIRVCTDLLGRADTRAGKLAEIADARRAAGLKCERDYDALEVRP